METITIAVGGDKCGLSPVLPYIGKRVDGTGFATLAKLYSEAALLRCEFDVLDLPTDMTEPQDMIMRVNRYGADAAIVLSYSAFGSRRSFNDIRGVKVKHAHGRSDASRVFAEDICAKLGGSGNAEIEECDSVWRAAACPAASVCGGYLTNFDEAKRSLDPDHAKTIAEYTAMGVCEYFGMPYIPDLRTPIGLGFGKRGKKIKLIQALLCANGYEVSIDGVYGKSTDAALNAFRKDAGLLPFPDSDDAELYNALVSPDYIPYTAPQKNTVMYLQRKLYAKLYNCTVNGVPDTQTLDALNEFLNDCGFERSVSGISELSADEWAEVCRTGGGRPRLF